VNDRLYPDTGSNTFSGEQVPSSGNWTYVSVSQPTLKGRRGMNVFRASGLGVIIAFSPVATGLDPWWNDRRNQVNLSQSLVFRPIVRQKISLLAARKLALDILYQAEKDRITAAEKEARRFVEIGL
jgi:hypothetical protein